MCGCDARDMSFRDDPDGCIFDKYSCDLLTSVPVVVEVVRIWENGKVQRSVLIVAIEPSTPVLSMSVVLTSIAIIAATTCVDDREHDVDCCCDCHVYWVVVVVAMPPI